MPHIVKKFFALLPICLGAFCSSPILAADFSGAMVMTATSSSSAILSQAIPRKRSINPVLSLLLGDDGKTLADLGIYKKGDKAPYALKISSPENWGGTLVGSDQGAVVSHANISVETSQVTLPQDGKKVTWSGAAQVLSQAGATADRQSYLDAKAALVFDVIVHQAPADLVKVRIDCGYPCLGELDGTTLFKNFALSSKYTVKLPLACFAAKGTNFATVDTPFLIYTSKAFSASFADIRWVAGAANDADAISCDSMVPPVPVFNTPVPGPSYTLFGDGIVNGGFQSNAWSTNGSHAAFALVPGAEMSLNFLADGGDGLFFFDAGTALNLINYASGKMEFEINVEEYGNNTSGLVVKMDSVGGCTSGDTLFGRPAVGQWQQYSINISDLTANPASCFDLHNISVPFGTLPKWGEQQGTKYSVRNVRFVQ
ncbi:MAG: putative glycoside hydrolase [Pseudomonadota bacterium]